MAEGGTRPRSRSLKDSLMKTSSDADESFCHPCESAVKYKPAKGYCQVCQEYLCEICLDVHQRQKITRAHAILDTEHMPRSLQGSASQQDLCVEVCQEHHPEIIRFYCKAHEKPGCGDCMTLNHMTCSKERVQDISGGFNKKKEFKDIDKKLQKLHQELEKMEGKLGDNLNNLDKAYNNILQKIATVRKQINHYLDQTEKKVKDEVAQLKKDDKMELKTYKADYQAMRIEIEVMLKALNDSNANLNSLFVISKQVNYRLATMEKDINKIKQSQQQTYEFHISDELEKLISTKTPLGKLSRKSSPKSKETAEEKQQDDQKTPRMITFATSAAYISSIDVKVDTDKFDCWITDCVVLSEGRAVAIDRNNYNVKLIDLRDSTVISNYITSSAPWGVTALSENTIAVTLHDGNRIHILNISSTLTLQRELHVKNGCYGIAHKDGKLAVSYANPGKVDILDIQGKILYTIQPKQGKSYVLQQPFYITFGQENDTVLVSDYNTSKVSVVTFKGQILRTYTQDTLRHPYGIVNTADGVLYVCSSGSIHAVSSDFKTSQIIINKDGYVMYPASVTYSEVNQTLYISNTSVGELGNQIRVYNVTLVPV